jgi:hypothetical protein
MQHERHSVRSRQQQSVKRSLRPKSSRVTGCVSRGAVRQGGPEWRRPPHTDVLHIQVAKYSATMRITRVPVVESHLRAFAHTRPFPPAWTHTSQPMWRRDQITWPLTVHTSAHTPDTRRMERTHAHRNRTHTLWWRSTDTHAFPPPVRTRQRTIRRKAACTHTAEALISEALQWPHMVHSHWRAVCPDDTTHSLCGVPSRSLQLSELTARATAHVCAPITRRGDIHAASADDDAAAGAAAAGGGGGGRSVGSEEPEPEPTTCTCACCACMLYTRQFTITECGCHGNFAE